VTIFYCLRFETSLCVASYDSQGPGGGIRESQVKVKIKVTLLLTTSQSVSFGVELHLGLMTRYLLLFDSYGLVLWGVLSDESTGLSSVYDAGPRQHSLSRVRVSWDSRPYFTLRFETSPFVASYDSQGHGGGIRPSLRDLFDRLGEY
jgi:hypothetical protein